MAGWKNGLTKVGIVLACVMGLRPPGQARASEPGKALAQAWRLYVGTYTNSGEPRSQGIYTLDLDLARGTLSKPRLAAEAVDPSFLAVHPSCRFLYAVNEVGEFQGHPGGGVSAFAIDPASGLLRPLNQQSSTGRQPCHISVDPSGSCALVANYGSGSVACLPIARDGQLQPAATSIQHQGSSVNSARQQGPHAHSINVGPKGSFAYAADLGLDKILIYALNAHEGTLKPADPPFTEIKPGSGPRHFTFGTQGRFAYVINELANTIVALKYDPATGKLEPIQTISTLPADFEGASFTADVHVHPSGRFLYGSNRGHDSIAVYEIDPSNGMLSLVEIEPTLGKAPRNFAIDPTGKFLLAENQDSDSIVLFRIDSETGKLEATGVKAAVSRPVCITMVPKP